MWLIWFMVTGWCVLAYLIGRPRQSLFIITFLATGCFQLIPVHWFWSPFLIAKPYDYAYVAMGLIIMFNFGSVAKICARNKVATFAVVYLSFLVLVLLASIVLFSYPKGKTIQSARVFFWPVFLLFFLLVDKSVLERFVRNLYPIVFVLAVVYLSQPFHGRAIINPSSEYFNPYLGSTDMKRYLSTPDFLIFFLLISYYRLCVVSGNGIGGKTKLLLGFLLFVSVQVVSFTRSAIMGTGVALLYVSRRVVNPFFLALFLASVLGAGAIAYATSDLVAQRVDETASDVLATIGGSYQQLNAAKDGNFSFRIAHLHERMAFISNDVARWPIGVGFVHEDSAVAQNLGFRIGLKNIYTGRVVQVDTGDIAWSVVVIKTGFLGLGLLVYFLILSGFSVGPSVSEWSTVYRAGLIYFVVTSFFSSSFVSPNQMLPLMLFLAVALRANEGRESVRSTGRFDLGVSRVTQLQRG